MNRSDFLKPRAQGTKVVFEMPVPENLMREKFTELNGRITVDVREQIAELRGVVDGLKSAVDEIRAVVASIPKWEKAEKVVIPPIDFSVVIEAINKPRTRTITATRGEHGLINLNSVIITEK